MSDRANSRPAATAADRQRSREWLADALGVSGAALLCCGAWQIFRPAAFILAGVTMIIAGIGLARSGARATTRLTQADE